MTLPGSNPQSATSFSRTRRKTRVVAYCAVLIALPLTGVSVATHADHKSDPVHTSRYHDRDVADPIERRQERQRRRIEKGQDNGDLTRSEARELYRQQEKIASAKYRYEADGYLSTREIDKLTRHLDRASHRIHRYRNNSRYRRGSKRYSHYDHHAYGYVSPPRVYGHLPRPHHSGPRIYLDFGHRGHGRYKHHHRNHHRHGSRRFGHDRRSGHRWPDRKRHGHYRH